MTEKCVSTPPSEPRVIVVTQDQLARIERAWELCAHPSVRRITNRGRIGWWYWAIQQVTGLDLRAEPAFTFEVVNG